MMAVTAKIPDPEYVLINIAYGSSIVECRMEVAELS